ncbi:hypothetical protein SLA2020_453770 [Shorea laevis]
MCQVFLNSWPLTLDYNRGLKSFEIEAPNLKKLVLNSPIVTEKWLHDVLSKHPLIESLDLLYHCNMLKMIKISSDRMKSLKISGRKELVEVNIVTPNLHRLEYCDDVVSTTSYSTWTLLEAPNLKELVLSSSIVTDKWLHGVLSKHPLIESLDLTNCELLKMIKISSDRMKSLKIICCKNLVEANIVTPNLHRLKYHGDAISFSSNTWTLSEVSLNFVSNTRLDVEKIEFLAKLSHPKY